MRYCLKCNEILPNRIKIENKTYNIQSRKYCLKCSPFKKHNTQRIHIDKELSAYCGRNYDRMTDEQKLIYNKYTYEKNMKKRRDKRKKDLVMIHGGKCIKCNYDKNIHNLCFHHREPNKKLFEVNSHSLSGRKWNVLVEESNKCDLLCFHCHNDHHYPNGLNWKN